MRKVIFIIGIIICISLLAAYKIHSDEYKIVNNVEEIKSALEKEMNIYPSNDTPREITIQKIINNKNKIYVLYSYSNSFIGEAGLTKGWNNKYKTEFNSYNNTMLVHFKILKSNNDKNLVIWGENKNGKIHDMKVTVENKELSIKAPSEEYFILVVPVDKNVKIDTPTEYKMYDEHGNDITTEYSTFGI